MSISLVYLYTCFLQLQEEHPTLPEGKSSLHRRVHCIGRDMQDNKVSFSTSARSRSLNIGRLLAIFALCIVFTI